MLLMKILKDVPVSRFSHKSELGMFWDFWGAQKGEFRPKKWTPSLADECLPHRKRGHDPPLI